MSIDRSKWWASIFSTKQSRKTRPEVGNVDGWDSGVVLVGYCGKPWCFSARIIEDGIVDVALYDATPETVISQDYTDASYHQVKHVAGWGWEVVSLLKAERKATSLLSIDEVFTELGIA